jgi:hypothetical protein
MERACLPDLVEMDWYGGKETGFLVSRMTEGGFSVMLFQSGQSFSACKCERSQRSPSQVP